MLHFHGTYRFKETTIGVRNDWCNCCRKERLTVQRKSFDMYHFSFVPLIPLGWRTRWICTECGANPRTRYQTPRLLKQLALGFIILFFTPASFMFWTRPVTDEMPIDVIWGMRILLPLVIAACVYFGFVRQPPDDDFTGKEHRQHVVPLDAKTCPLCHSPLTQISTLTCARCKVRVFTTTE